MKVHHASAQVKAQARHTMLVSPAADMPNTAVSAAWVDDDNKPLTLAVEFAYGQAHVEDDMGKYLIERGLAKRSTLWTPR